MSVTQIAGLIVVVGSLLFLVTPFVGSASLYRLAPEDRMAWIEGHSRTVAIQNSLVAIGSVMVAVGYVTWSIETVSLTGWINATAAITIALAAASTAAFFYQTTKSPESYHVADHISEVGYASFVLMSAAAVLYGVLFLQAATPDWVGLLSIVVGAFMGGALVIAGGKELLPQPYYVVTLVAGALFLIEAGL